MKKVVATLAVVLSLGLAAVTDAEAAKRLGGGKSSGMQRENVTAPAATPGRPAQSPTAPAATPAPAAAPAAAAANSGARKWLGPIAGIAAGLGLAALASHLGFGEELASFMMIALLAMVVLAVVGLIMRKRMAGATPAPAGAAPGWNAPSEPAAQPATMERTAQGSTPGGIRIGSGIGSAIGSGLAQGATAAAWPAGFDAAGFARTAESQFVALQAANDAGDLARLREFLADELYEQARQEIATRGSAPQKTEVYGLQAQVLQVAEETQDWVASVRFTGRIRHEAGAEPEDFDEVWHLSKPRVGNGGWVLAGIQQMT